MRPVSGAGAFACQPCSQSAANNSGKVHKLMSSLRLTIAARANGARSRGPATPEGKRRSSQNATSHGLLARCIVMENESRTAFEALIAQHCDRLQPADALEFGFIEEMAAAY